MRRIGGRALPGFAGRKEIHEGLTNRTRYGIMKVEGLYAVIDRAPGPKTAYDPAALDRSVRRYVGVAEKNLAVMESIGDDIPSILEKFKARVKVDAEAFDDLERLTVVYDRLVKAGLNLVKATDELSRLQSFLGGGPDSRPDLTAASEIHLRELLVTAIRQLGPAVVQALIGVAQSETSPSA